MIKIIKDFDVVSIDFSDSNIELVRLIDITFNGAIEAISALPADWTITANSERMICLNLGTLNPSEIFNYVGNIKIKNIKIYDSKNNSYNARVVVENNDYWENVGEVFESSGGYYETYDKENISDIRIKSTKIITNNLSTKPDEFYLQDKTPYQGGYHMHQDGRTMTGSEHTNSSIHIYRKDANGNIITLSGRGKKRGVQTARPQALGAKLKNRMGIKKIQKSKPSKTRRRAARGKGGY